MFDALVLVRGGGDLGSGVALRLWRCGFPVVVLESPQPIAVRRTVAFAEAVFDEAARVEEATGRRISFLEQVPALLRAGEIPVLVDPGAETVVRLEPRVLVDAIMAKRNTGTDASMARLVVALGPGFAAGQDVHAVVETNRGPNLGRVIWRGCAEPNTGEPGAVRGLTSSRVLRAPASGRLQAARSIGDVVREGEVVAEVAGMPITAAFDALVRGLARDGIRVEAGMKVGDLDPRLDPGLCDFVSDKALAIAGGVLEAILLRLRQGDL